MARFSQTLAVVVLLAALISLTACGSPQASPTTTAQAGGADNAQPTSAATSAAQATPEASATAARAEATATTAPAATETSAGGGGESQGVLTVYSGRSEELVGPLIKQFEQDSGIEVDVKYGDTAQLAAAILEEGDVSPADVFFAQDAGALGAIRNAGLLAQLDQETLSQVEERFRAADGTWTGVSGRARVIVYNPDLIKEEELPNTIFGYTDPRWKGKLGWAPTNGSFQAFVTALRVLGGDENAQQWLEGIQANEPKVYPSNSAIVEAVANGEVTAGFVNHYYLFRELEEHGESFKARNYYLRNGDPGALINVAGVGVLKSSDQPELAKQFVAYLLSRKAQQYFSEETFEYPLMQGVEADPRLPRLEEIQTPAIDLSDLEDLEGTLQLLQEAGVL